MSFAELQLKKYGWKEGKGLGLKENGIVNALKPTLKCNTLGIGFNPAEDFSPHWSDHIYNKAANSLCVSTDEGGRIKIKKDSKRKSEKEEKKRKQYGNFVKGSVLNESGEHAVTKEDRNSSADSRTDQTKNLPKLMTDHELFKYCGGLTAHKGARHGVTMSAKMARLQQQENNYLLNKVISQDTILDKTLSSKVSSSLNDGHSENKPKIKKSKKDSIESSPRNYLNGTLSENNIYKSSSETHNSFNKNDSSISDPLENKPKSKKIKDVSVEYMEDCYNETCTENKLSETKPETYNSGREKQSLVIKTSKKKKKKDKMLESYESCLKIDNIDASSFTSNQIFKMTPDNFSCENSLEMLKPCKDDQTLDRNTFKKNKRKRRIHSNTGSPNSDINTDTISSLPDKELNMIIGRNTFVENASELIGSINDEQSLDIKSSKKKRNKDKAVEDSIFYLQEINTDNNLLMKEQELSPYHNNSSEILNLFNNEQTLEKTPSKKKKKKHKILRHTGSPHQEIYTDALSSLDRSLPTNQESNIFNSHNENTLAESALNEKSSEMLNSINDEQNLNEKSSKKKRKKEKILKNYDSSHQDVNIDASSLSKNSKSKVDLVVHSNIYSKNCSKDDSTLSMPVCDKSSISKPTLLMTDNSKNEKFNVIPDNFDQSTVKTHPTEIHRKRKKKKSKSNQDFR